MLESLAWIIFIAIFCVIFLFLYEIYQFKSRKKEAEKKPLSDSLYSHLNKQDK